MSRDNEHSGEIVAFENVAAGSILLDIQNYKGNVTCECMC